MQSPTAHSLTTLMSPPITPQKSLAALIEGTMWYLSGSEARVHYCNGFPVIAEEGVAGVCYVVVANYPIHLMNHANGINNIIAEEKPINGDGPKSNAEAIMSQQDYDVFAKITKAFNVHSSLYIMFFVPPAFSQDRLEGRSYELAYYMSLIGVSGGWFTGAIPRLVGDPTSWTISGIDAKFDAVRNASNNLTFGLPYMAVIRSQVLGGASTPTTCSNYLVNHINPSNGPMVFASLGEVAMFSLSMCVTSNALANAGAAVQSKQKLAVDTAALRGISIDEASAAMAGVDNLFPGLATSLLTCFQNNRQDTPPVLTGKLVAAADVHKPNVANLSTTLAGPTLGAFNTVRKAACAYLTGQINRSVLEAAVVKAKEALAVASRPVKQGAVNAKPFVIKRVPAEAPYAGSVPGGDDGRASKRGRYEDIASNAS